MPEQPTPNTPELPGRLGIPGMTLKDDPRADPRLVAAFAPLGLDVPPEPLPVDCNSPIEDLLAWVVEAEVAFDHMGEALLGQLPAVEGVTSATEEIKGVDGNSLLLSIHRPAQVEGPLPGIVHFHGGGMVILRAASLNYVRWRDELAARGHVVIGVEFRNAAGVLGVHPFPAGLNDCASGVQWVHDNRAQLGISKVVLSGESGGGNLSLATALKAKREGWIDRIDGVYALCPHISNQWAEKSPDLPSLYENDEYFISTQLEAVMSRIYDPTRAHATDPLCWPYHAGPADLAGLPPHVISVNELDLLRDEGLAYFRKLLHAGVRAVSRTVNGTCHAGDCLFPAAIPDVYHSTIRDIKGFADSL